MPLPVRAALVGLAAVTLTACGAATVVGSSAEAILLRVPDQAAVQGTRAQAEEHCAKRYRTPVLVSADPLGDEVLARWECR